MIYLDYTANTPADADVLQAFIKTEQTYIANPNSVHAAGRAAHEEMARAITSIAELLKVQPSELICTSGASESNNTAILGLAHAYRHTGKHIITTMLEHASVSGTLTSLQERGYEIDLADVRRDGTIDIEHVRELLRPDTVMVAVCAVDSELGTIQPIRELASLLASYPNCHLHVDATQAIGKIPFSFDGIDTASLAPHKFYGLNGSGLLFKRDGVILEPLIHGGASTTIYRSGTPALGLAVSMETALKKALEEPAFSERLARVKALNALLRGELAARDGVFVNSPAHAVAHILNVSVPGIRGDAMQKALDERGICVSVKSACSVPGTPSKPVFAVTRDKKRALSSFRISLSHLTTDAQIHTFLEAFDDCRRMLSR